MTHPIIPDELLTEQWENINWNKAQDDLYDAQLDIYYAAKKKAWDSVRKLQRKLTENIDFRCLAVKRVADANSCPGVDKFRLRNSAEKMQMAYELNNEGYKASPVRHVTFNIRTHGKVRHATIPIKFDRAMAVLHAFTLLPVEEAHSDYNSFAFRKGKSAHDAHTHLFKALIGEDAPGFVVVADIKSYYASIKHSWIMKHIPMDKDVLYQFLTTDIVPGSRLFPDHEVIMTEDRGISEGSNISPYIGNYVLDGLQSYVYNALYPDGEKDYYDGFMVRYADDIIFTARSYERGEQILRLVDDFISERGLRFNRDKTMIREVKDGFDFLSFHYSMNQNGILKITPREDKVDQYINEIKAVIDSHTKSQRDLIERLNASLRGWAGYYKFADAYDAFVKVDNAIDAILLNHAIEKHPHWSKEKVIEKYWYLEGNDKRYYTLSYDRTVRIIKIQETVLVRHKAVDPRTNIFSEPEYYSLREQFKEINNVTGKYRSIWRKYEGKCYFCGNPILVDQAKTIRTILPDNNPNYREQVYVHELCAMGEWNLIRLNDEIPATAPFDYIKSLEDIELSDKNTNTKKPPTNKWKWHKLRMHFATLDCYSVTLKFSDIEKISGHKLPDKWYTYDGRRAWYPFSNVNGIAEAWYLEGYEIHKLDIYNHKITLHRIDSDLVRLNIPDVLRNGKIPKNAKSELETHMNAIVKKYGLTKKKRKKGKNKG